MLANQNKIILISLGSVAISGGLVIFTLFKALDKNEFKPLVDAQNLRLERNEPQSETTSDSIPKPIIITTLPGVGLAPSPSTRGMIVSKDKLAPTPVWNSEEKDKILGKLKISQVSDQAINIIDGNKNYRVTTGNYLESKPSVRLIKINNVVREIMFGTKDKNITVYY